MNLATRIAALVDRLADLAARIAATGGIADPSRAAFADLSAVYLFGGGGREEDRAELTVRCRRAMAEDPDGRTALGSLAGKLLAAGGVVA